MLMNTSQLATASSAVSSTFGSRSSPNLSSGVSFQGSDTIVLEGHNLLQLATALSAASSTSRARSSPKLNIAMGPTKVVAQSS